MKVIRRALDPEVAWQAAPAERWDAKWASHLYRRAAFGFPPRRGTGPKVAPWRRLAAAVERGRDAALDELLNSPAGEADYDSLLDDIGRRLAAGELDKLQGWWLYRILHSPHPLRERMTLFWHDHFATSVTKVRDNAMMFEQNRLLRKHALGKFGPLLAEIGRDPAMLIWLDGAASARGKPNENYAREVMELFALGVGNYSERDIQEAARALTGWSLKLGAATFDEARHDGSEKTILGTTGKWRDDDVARILLEQPAAARLIARRLFAQFVSEGESPSDELIQPLAEQLRKSDYDIAACLRTIFQSSIFYSDVAWRARIKSPVDYVVGLLMALDVSPAVDNLALSMQGLGQSLFAPPNVKGWDGGATWLNSATLLSRHNLARQRLDDKAAENVVAGKPGEEANARAEFLLKLFVDGEVSPEGARLLNEWMALNLGGEMKGTWTDFAHTILMLPEYQMA